MLVPIQFQSESSTRNFRIHIHFDDHPIRQRWRKQDSTKLRTNESLTNTLEIRNFVRFQVKKSHSLTDANHLLGSHIACSVIPHSAPHRFPDIIPILWRYSRICSQNFTNARESHVRSLLRSSRGPFCKPAASKPRSHRATRTMRRSSNNQRHHEPCADRSVIRSTGKAHR